MPKSKKEKSTKTSSHSQESSTGPLSPSISIDEIGVSLQDTEILDLVKTEELGELERVSEVFL